MVFADGGRSAVYGRWRRCSSPLRLVEDDGVRGVEEWVVGVVHVGVVDDAIVAHYSASK